MKNELKGKYYIKNKPNGTYTDVTELFDGVRILTIKGFFDQGETTNVYNAQWVNSQTEDFIIPDTDENDEPIVVRKNMDIEITFIVGQRYASETIDAAKRHDQFIRYLTNSDVWILSKYAKKKVRCMNLESYSPTVAKLCRGDKSFMMGTIKLHMLEMPTDMGQDGDTEGYEDPTTPIDG